MAGVVCVRYTMAPGPTIFMSCMFGAGRHRRHIVTVLRIPPSGRVIELNVVPHGLMIVLRRPFLMLLVF